MRLTVVGSGTAVPDPERVGSAFFVDALDTRVLVDCGPGAVHHMARFGLPWGALDHVLITHFHNDHTGDLPALLFGLKWGLPSRRTRPLTVSGPAGLRARIRAMAAAFGDHVLDPGFAVHLRELEPGPVPLDPLHARCHPAPHTPDSLAYRLDDGASSVGFTGDTAESVDVAGFLAGVDLLVAECSVPDDEPVDTHLSPSGLARMAARAAPGRLMVTHVYPSLARQDVADLLRQAGWSGPTVRAEDGLRVQVGVRE